MVLDPHAPKFTVCPPPYRHSSGMVIVKQHQHPFRRLPRYSVDPHFAPRESGMMLVSRSWSKSKASFPSSLGSPGWGKGGECNRASGGLMASRCKCSQSGTQATYPPTDALCQLTPYNLIILFSLLLLSFPLSPSSVSFITLARQTKLLY